MGLVFSQENFTVPLSLTEEVETSIRQILNAFQQELPVESQQQTHDQYRDYPSVSHSSSTQNKEPSKSSHSKEHQRSRSLDQDHSEEPQHNIQTKLSATKRQWQCQFCHTKNKSDIQICTECGSNKINVYVPIMDRLGINRNLHVNNSLRSSTIHHQNRKISTKNENVILLEEENVHRRSVLAAHKREVDERLVLQHVEKIRLTCSKTHSKFKDKNFPASPHSLYINGNSFSKPTLSFLPDQQQQQMNINPSSSSNSNIQWCRPDQIIPQEWTDNVRTEWTVFRDPRPDDVLQGTLGDCWFITALSVLAEEPEYITRVLMTKQCNYEGIYCVRLCKDGEWTQVTVDDRLPCTPDQRLAYSQAHRKQLWVPLIEKALAKLNGSYEAIIAGRCCEGLTTVTGSACETLVLGRSINPDDKNVDHDRLWSKLLNARSKRFLMCAMCSNNLITNEEFERYGLLNVHAYSLQDIKESKDGKHKLVKLRNPWGGTHRWTGDWSDDSRLWYEHPDLRHELLAEKRNKRDGVFWMPFASFIRYFECVDICKLRHHWYEVRDSANFYPASKMIQAYYLKVLEVIELDITLYKKISKNLRSQRSHTSLCIAILNMEEQSSGNYRIYAIPIVSQRGQHKFISTEGHLQPGTYVILPLLFNPNNKSLDNTDFTIAIHSSHAIELERIKIPLRIEREFLIKLCIFYGESSDKGNSSDKSNTHSDGVTIYELEKHWNGLIVLVENRHPSKYVHFYFNCIASQNISISRKDSQRELFDVIPPNYRQIIVTLSGKSPSHGYTLGHDCRYELSSQEMLKYGPGINQKHWPNIDENKISDDIHLPQCISSAKQF